MEKGHMQMDDLRKGSNIERSTRRQKNYGLMYHKLIIHRRLNSVSQEPLSISSVFIVRRSTTELKSDILKSDITWPRSISFNSLIDGVLSTAWTCKQMNHATTNYRQNIKELKFELFILSRSFTLVCWESWNFSRKIKR